MEETQVCPVCQEAVDASWTYVEYEGQQGYKDSAGRWTNHQHLSEARGRVMNTIAEEKRKSGGGRREEIAEAILSGDQEKAHRLLVEEATRIVVTDKGKVSLDAVKLLADIAGAMKPQAVPEGKWTPTPERPRCPTCSSTAAFLESFARFAPPDLVAAEAEARKRLLKSLTEILGAERERRKGL